MKYKLLILSFLISNCCFGQVNTVLDNLDSPIAFTFVDDDVYLALHGAVAQTGQIVKFNVSDPLSTYQVLFDSLTYPRAIIEKDNMLYIGLRDAIVTYDLSNPSEELDTILYNQFMFPRSFEFDGNDLVVALKKSLFRMDFSDSVVDIERLFGFDESPLSLARKNNELYIAVGTSIQKVDLTTNTISEVISDLEFVVYSILIVDNRLYLDQGNSMFGNERIIVFDLNNLGAGSELFCGDLGSVISMQEFEGQIYFASQKPVFNDMPEGEIQVINKSLVNTANLVEGTFKIFPNPTNTTIKIDSENPLNYKLLNSNGQTILKGNSLQPLDMTVLPIGLYILHLRDINGDYVDTRKVLKTE